MSNKARFLLNTDIGYINEWCGGLKISGITDTLIEECDPKVSWLLEIAAKEGYSSVVVSVNETEKIVIEWLEKNKFMKGPDIRNWGHYGRKTCLYFKQVTEARWRNA